HSPTTGTWLPLRRGARLARAADRALRVALNGPLTRPPLSFTRPLLEEFEQDLSGNLYKLWNRLSSGSYFPPPVRAVEIPKKDGSSRVLGVPALADRIAQVVVRSYVEPNVEPVFHDDSYGYRPGRPAHDALGVWRERCWRNDWVLDMDIRKFCRHRSR